MNLITIEQARAHCKTDSDDDALLTVYASAAEQMCARAADRYLFKDIQAQEAAIADIPAAMAAAFLSYRTAMDAAALLTDEDAQATAETIAEIRLSDAKSAQTYLLDGMTVTDDIIAAVLLTTGHLYRNREDVVTGQSAAALKLPNGADAIMRHYRKVGPL